ncbi:MAG: 3-deoxy-D-manno-octulosonic acid transferase [Acidobacteriota bacterium]
MYFIYSLLLGLGFLILLPRFLLDAFRHGKYVAGFRERWGVLAPIPGDDRPVIWVHCVSVGETQAARPLVQAIKRQFPQSRIAISTITQTGQNLAREIFKQEAAKVFYFPFDWRWVVRRTLKAIKPDTVLVMETELWPGFLRECKQQQVPVALVNGRLSAQSFRRYRLIRSFMTRVLTSLNLAIMQTEADADRLCALGMASDKTFVAGNMKFDAGTDSSGDSLTKGFQERFNLSAGAQLVLAASTHDPEEVLIVNSFRQVVSRSEANPRLVIAPRHPERFGEVAELLKMSGLRWSRRSAPPDASDGQSEVILLDSIGELRSIYSLASIVFVGGSIAKTGGHNVIEPAALGVPVIVGPHTYNFQSIVEAFVRAGAIVQLKPMSDSATIAALANTISELLAEPARAREIGKLAQKLVSENRGATERTLQLLESVLSIPENVSEATGPLRTDNAPIA